MKKSKSLNEDFDDLCGSKKYNTAIYCRLSTEDLDKMNRGDDSESIQNQKLLLIDYAMSQNFNIYKIYSDDDYSGLDRNRPQFIQMIKDAEEGLFNIVLCKTQSRFTRDMEMVEKYIHGLFPLWGVRFISIVDNVDTNVKGNKKSRQINALINEWYCEDLSENIRAVFKKKMLDGQFIGSFAPYGYMKSPEDRHNLIIDDAAAEAVREIYGLYLRGHGCVQIAGILTGRGVPTPTAYKKQNGLNYENPNGYKYGENYGVWSSNTVKRILKNETYTGCLIQGRERKISYKSAKVAAVPRDEWIIIKENHEPIIDGKTFTTVQNLMTNKRSVHKPKSGYKGTESAHVLAGKVICHDCGSPMHIGATGRNGAKYLRCRLSKKTQNRRCTPHGIKLDQLRELIVERITKHVRNHVENDKNMLMLKESFENMHDGKKNMEATKREISAYTVKIEKIMKTIANAYTDKVSGLISVSDFIGLKQIYDAEAESLRNKKLRLEEKAYEMNARYMSFTNADALIHQCVNSICLTHEIVNDFIDFIQVGEKDESGVQKVSINWSF